IDWPEAEAAEKIDEKQKNILNIWMEQDGSIYINDQPVPMENVSQVVAPLYADSDRRLVISVRGDRDVPYRYMDLVQQELVSAGVVRVVFAAQMEQAMQRQRR
ncbi:MAG: biopolymer transporter ExbD, partial [Longimicrobiales bacterium]|nr:biopolymer transporter ExbD [Longimicrobiales bacterium]